MSETKAQLHERKIRNGLRREEKRQQKIVWKKLQDTGKTEDEKILDRVTREPKKPKRYYHGGMFRPYGKGI